MYAASRTWSCVKRGWGVFWDRAEQLACCEGLTLWNMSGEQRQRDPRYLHPGVQLGAICRATGCFTLSLLPCQLVVLVLALPSAGPLSPQGMPCTGRHWRCSCASPPCLVEKRRGRSLWTAASWREGGLDPVSSGADWRLSDVVSLLWAGALQCRVPVEAAAWTRCPKDWTGVPPQQQEALVMCTSVGLMV